MTVLRLARYRCAIAPLRRKLARQYRHHRIVTRIVVIVQVLIAQRNPEHPLSDQRLDLVLNQTRSPLVLKALGKTINQTDRLIRRPQ